MTRRLGGSRFQVGEKLGLDPLVFFFSKSNWAGDGVTPMKDILDIIYSRNGINGKAKTTS